MRIFYRTWLFSILSFTSIAQMPKLMLPIGHNEQIDFIELSYNTKRIYTYSKLDNAFKVWDVYSGKLLIDLNTEHFSISSDQKKISIALNDSTIRIWDVVNDDRIDFKLLRNGIKGSKFSPDNKLLLTFSVDDICIWDASTGVIKNKFKNNNLNYYLRNNDKLEPEFSSNSKDILFLTYENTLNIWNITTNSLSTVDLDKGFAISSVKFSPDSSKILVTSYNPEVEGSYYNFVKIWDYHTGKFVSQLISNDNFRYAEFSPNGKKLVTISNKINSDTNRVKIWDVNSGLQLYTLSFNKSYVRNANKKSTLISFDTENVDMCESFKFSSDGKRLLVFYQNAKAKLWDADNGKLLSEFSDTLLHKKDNIRTIHSVEFSKDETKILVIAADYARFTEIWDSNTGKLITYLRDSSNHLEQSKFSFNGKLVITLNSNNTARLWEIDNPSKITDYNFNGHTEINPDVQFSPDNKSILTIVDNKLYLWELNTGSLLMSLKGHTRLITSARFSTDGKSIVSASKDGTAKIWDSITGTVKFNLVYHKDGVNYAEFSKDQEFVVTASDDGTSIIWNANTGTALSMFQLGGSDEVGNTHPVLSAHFSDNSKRIIIRPYDGTVKLLEWDKEQAKIITNLKFSYKDIPVTNPMTVAIFSHDSKKIFSASNGGRAAVWDASNGKMLNEFKISPNVIVSAQFSPDNKKVVAGNYSETPQIISSDTTSVETIKLNGHSSYVLHAEYNYDGKRVLTVSDDKTIKIWDANTGTELTSLEGHTNQVYTAHFSFDQKKILSTSYDNTIKIWNAHSGDLILTFFVVDSMNYFSQIPSKFYRASPEATKLLHYVTKDLKIISFEQLDVKYNRPDKVLQAIGNTDTTLIQSYKLAYEKRIQKLRIDTTAFSDDYYIPEADFVNREPMIENGKVVLRIKGEDKKSKLDQFNVWVNEVPVYGLRGVNIRHLNSYKLDTTITIQLSEGENRIETSVRNINAIESYRMPLIIKYNSATKPKEKVYFVGIGIDKFKDNSRNLMYSVKDIRVLTTEMQKKYGSSLVIVDTLINTKVTIENVKALKKKLLSTTVNDKVIVAYSGHGLLNEKNDYYLSTYSVNFKKPEENGLNYDDLESIIDSIPARKKLLLLDACHSGEVDRETHIKVNKTDLANNATTTSNEGTKGGPKPLDNLSKNRIGLKNSFELMQSLFVNVGKNTGATIFTAAAGEQAAYESNSLEHGVFTYFIIEAFRNKPTLTVSRLKEFVAQNVEKESKKSQIPTSRSETIAVDWVLW